MRTDIKRKSVIVCLCLLAGTLVWYLWPEYGSGYSEQQRRLWNERRTLYPVAWVLDEMDPDQRTTSPPYADISNLTGESGERIGQFVKEKSTRDKELKQRLEKNRDSSGVEYGEVEFSRADVSRLPLDGLTEREVAGRALDGDGEACMKMVQLLCGESSYGVVGLSWRKRNEVEKWLDRIIGLKRPGGEFLKNCFQEVLAFQKKKIRPEGGIMMGGCPEMKDIPGYDEYLECLKKGDYPLYRTASCMLFNENSAPGESGMFRGVLLREARRGNVDAQRNLAALCFEPALSGDRYMNSIFRSGMSREVGEKRKKWKDFLQVLPVSWREYVMSGLAYCKVFDPGSTQTMERHREAARYARSAALQGDLTSMYLWLRVGIMGMAHFSAEEWNDIFQFDRILMASGYIPYWEEPDRKALDYAILESFYPQKSYKNWKRFSVMASRGRWKRSMYGSRSLSDIGISAETGLEEMKRKVSDIELVGQTDSLVDDLTRNDFSSEGLLSQVNRKVYDYLWEQLNKWAAEGDLHALVRTGRYL